MVGVAAVAVGRCEVTTISYLNEAGGKSAVVGHTEFVIGRSLYCTMVVDDPSVSRLHASIRRAGNCCEIVDLGSSNGTFVNSERVGAEPVRVKPDDEIRVGSLRIRLIESSEPSRERTRTSPHLYYAAQAEDDSPTLATKRDWKVPEDTGSGGESD
jgi:pSer/pThr/pTyr-binding forkhead associated (FHA) protein